jgi:hypothetical protein
MRGKTSRKLKSVLSMNDLQKNARVKLAVKNDEPDEQKSAKLSMNYDEIVSKILHKQGLVKKKSMHAHRLHPG